MYAGILLWISDILVHACWYTGRAGHCRSGLQNILGEEPGRRESLITVYLGPGDPAEN
jgi:hypothetical protein